MNFEKSYTEDIFIEDNVLQLYIFSTNTLLAKEAFEKIILKFVKQYNAYHTLQDGRL